ncbi:Hypothetical protein ABZS17H1_02024 [Kosakonia cowanii]|jgi:hypothetical protein
MAATPYPAYKNGLSAKPVLLYIRNMTARGCVPAEIGEPKRE